MSLTFSTNHPTAANDSRVAACMCAQDAPSWCDVVDLELEGGMPSTEQLDELRDHAWDQCPTCGGQGHTLERPFAPMLSLANVNARALFGVLGLPFAEAGVVTIAEARRAVMRARARTELGAFERPAIVVTGAPIERDGVVELRPVRARIGGLDAEMILDRVERLAELVEQGAADGATVLCWS